MWVETSCFLALRTQNAGLRRRQPDPVDAAEIYMLPCLPEVMIVLHGEQLSGDRPRAFDRRRAISGLTVRAFQNPAER